MSNYGIRMERRQKAVEMRNRHGIEIRKTSLGEQGAIGRKPKALKKIRCGLDILFLNLAYDEIFDYDTVSILEYLNEHDFSAAYLVKNSRTDSDEDLLTRLDNLDAKFVAVKVSAAQNDNTLAILEKLGDTNKCSRIILWGPGCRTESQRKELSLNLVDGIIFQEYEKAFKKLIFHSQNDPLDPCIPGVYVPGQPFIPLPPTRDLSNFPFPRYKGLNFKIISANFLPLRLSRGCPHRCSFCSIYFEQGPYCVRKAQSVYEEMRYHLETKGISEYIFQDRAINGNRETLLGLCDILAGNKIPITWKAKYIVHDGENDFPFREMAAAGCTHLNFGFISGSDHVLKLMGKPMHVETLERALLHAHGSDIQTVMRLMVGFPGESERDYLDTMAFVLKNVKFINKIDLVSPCYIQPGSDLEKAHERYGIILPRTNRWRGWHNGSYNNFSYRLKKSKEIAILLKELGILSTLPPYVKEDVEILKKRDQIVERCRLHSKNLFKGSPPRKLNATYFASPYDPVGKGIFSDNKAFAGPETLEVDLTNNCNLSCIGCWCHSPLLGDQKFSGEKKKKYLPKKIILSLLGEARRLGGHTTVQLAGAGEPFLHPDIWEIIEAVKKQGMGCGIITNFTLLKEEDIRRLIDLGVQFITASVWAGDAETYARTHPGAPTHIFERLLKNLSILSKSRGLKGFPRIKIYHVVNTKNADNIDSMVDFAVRAGADSVELTMVDVVPGKTDALHPDSVAQERILAQFNGIRGRSDYTSEFIRTEHLKPFDDKMFYEELKEFGRIYPVLREGFSYDSDYKSVRCPNGKRSIRKGVSLEDSSVTFMFDKGVCEECAQKKNCWSKGIELGCLSVRPMTILGAGSFLRRLTSSKQEIQEYEHKIIDRVPCTVGWTYARITVDGNVIPCCKASEFSLGNLHQDSFDRIWHAPLYSEFRQKAKELSKKDPYFSKINCYRSCDNLGMNLHTYLRLLNYIKK